MLYKAAAAQYEQTISRISAGSTTQVVRTISRSFRRRQKSRSKELLHCSIILVNDAQTVEDSIITKVLDDQGRLESTATVLLDTTECTNVKTALAFTVSAVLSQWEDCSPANRPGPQHKVLPYDLAQLIPLTEQEHPLRNIIIAAPSVEPWSNGFLEELLAHLDTWRDRLSISLLLGVSTSLDLLLQRIPSRALHKLQISVFDARSSGSCLDEAYEQVVCTPVEGLLLGGDVIQSLAGRQLHHLGGLAEFTSTTKYALMSHCFANPLSVFANRANDLDVQTMTGLHCRAVRQLLSFRLYCEGRDEASGTSDDIADFLESDDALCALLKEQLPKTAESLGRLLQGLKTVAALKRYLIPSSGMSNFDMHAQALTGKASFGFVVKQCTIALKSLSPKQLAHVLELLPEGLEDFDAMRALYTDLLREADRDDDQLQVLTDKLAVSSQTSTKKGYNQILQDLALAFKAYCAATFLTPAHLPFSEIFLCTLKSTSTPTLTPSLRSTLSWALSRPHDYLDCACCPAGSQALAPTQPAAAVLYQLVCESGALVNVWDLWTAFRAVVKADDGAGEMGEEEEGGREAILKMRFYRGVAALRSLGLIKGSGRRKDCFARLAWDGL